LVTNEGNGRLVTSLPPVHIAVMGMERIVPTWEELEVMVGLLCRSAVGQKLTSYINCLTGPKAAGDADGPEEFHLVIVDNGRSDILGTEFQSVLQCIRCGACLNVCPVYRHIGGQAYGSIYSGPIGAVLSPLLGGEDLYRELPYTSSLCAACTEACPVKIPLHELLIQHRQKTAEEERQTPLGERLAMKTFGMVSKSPRLYRWGTKLARTALRPWEEDGVIRQGPAPLQPWTSIRDLPSPKRETFREWFENRRKRGEQP
jgi:L-lactate dehydrogenase complex protein LldF